MKAQSGFDIKVIVNELEALNGSRINKFYNTSEGELLIKFYSSKFGKKTLRVLRGECIHLTGFKRKIADNPSHFTMLMRKYMNGAVLKAVEQPFFERVVFFRIERGGENFNIVIELFNKGNIIVCDNNMVIINSLRFVEMKGRVIRPGEKYELPLPNFQELYLDQIEFRRTLKSSDKDSLVKCLAVDIGLGGKYAEELCALSGIDKMKNPAMLNKKESDKIFEVFFLIYKSIKHYKNIRPCVILKDGKAVDFAPFPLKSYEGYGFEMFETFNEACDYYYSRSQKEDYELQAKNVYDDRIKNLENRLGLQSENLKKLADDAEKYARLGGIVFANYDLISTTLEKIMNANKNNVSWVQIKKMVENEKEQGSSEAQIIESINEHEGTITLNINNEEFTIDLNSDVSSVAQEYFEKSKKLKNKLSGTRESIDETRSIISNVENNGVKVEKDVVKEEKIERNEWFEKYRWMRTTNNFLLVCGKDATQNEILIKKVAEDNDLIFHTSMSGSPFGVLKNGVNAGERDRQECAVFIAAYSRAWRNNIPADVFCVKKHQVSKSAPSGEYVSHGSFIIKGEKELFRNIWPEISIGYGEDGKIIAGPADVIKGRCVEMVKLLPGHLNPGMISKRLLSIFSRSFKSEELFHFIPGDARIEV